MSVLTFDCYGTLLNSDIIYEYIEKVAKEHGVDGQHARDIFTTYEDRLMYGEPYQDYDQILKQILEYCDFELKTDFFKGEYDNLIAIHFNFKLHPDVLPALKKLKEQGHQIYLMSNTMHRFMDKHLEQFDGVVDGVFLAEDMHCYKPDLNFFKQVQAKLAFTNDNHVHIAKGYWWDIVPATKLGWSKIWINRDQKQGFEREAPYLELPDLTDLVTLIKK